MDPESDRLPDFLFGRYRVEAVLREDAFGAVLHAFDTHLTRAVTIRAVRPQPGTQQIDEYRVLHERMAQEIEAAARIGFHSHVVPVLDFIHGDDGTDYLVTEHLPGGSLTRQISKGPLSTPDALRIAIDVARGLAVAHRAGVVHRDLKPGAIFLGGTGDAKVGGFGLAQVAGQDARTHAIILRLGTPQYMSPEQEAYFSPATDQYSLGLVLFEMLTGERFKQLDRQNAAILLGNHDGTAAPIIRRLLAQHPEDRFDSMEDVIAACAALVPAVEWRIPPPIELPHEPSMPPTSPPAESEASHALLAAVWGRGSSPQGSDAPPPDSESAPMVASAANDRDTPAPPSAPRRRLLLEIGLAIAIASIVVAIFTLPAPIPIARGGAPGNAAVATGTPVAPAPTARATIRPNPTPTLATRPGSSAIALGAYVSPGLWSASDIDQFTAIVGTDPAIVMWYQDWQHVPTRDFDTAIMDAVTIRGAMPLVTWEPWDYTGTAMQPAYALRTILAGDYDPYIRQWARDAAAWGKPMYLRFAHEMNASWYPWSAGVNGNTSAEYVGVWRHIWDIFHQAGASNVRWVWSPYVELPGTVPYAQLYPGDAFVDWVGLDGYNWGTSQSWSQWTDFSTLFGASYDRIVGLTSKPFLIAETASAEAGGDKAAWILHSLLSDVPTRFPAVRAVIWFDIDKETDWRVNSSPASLAAFRTVASAPLYRGRLP